MYFLVLLILCSTLVFVSIKLSVYVDNLEDSSGASSVLLGGILLALVTSMPELITGITSIVIGNTDLALGNMIGSNMFNLFVIGVLDLYFIKVQSLNKSSNNFAKMGILLILINFLVIVGFYKITILNISLLSLVILMLYIYFIKLLASAPDDDTLEDKETKVINNVKLKIFITSVLLVINSIALTKVADIVSANNAAINASTIGAFLLGITTSLPEVTTCFTLFKVKNYSLAIANIIGSNMFNFLVLFLLDIMTKSNIFMLMDNTVMYMVYAGFIMSVVLCYALSRTKSLNKLTYAIPSIIIVSIYFIVWYLQFIA